MKYINLIFAVAFACNVCSCRAGNPSTADSDLIKTVYETFVFAIDADPETYAHPERFFTANALKKLNDSYDFDCEDNSCYAYYELRTEQQDSKPGTDGESYIINIEPTTDNSYIVTYSDMGWTGTTLIQISNGKINNFTRCPENKPFWGK